MAKKKKTNKAEAGTVEQSESMGDVVPQVTRLILDGNSMLDIKEWLHETFPNENPLEIFTKTREHFRDAAYGDKEELLGFCIEATKNLYKEMKGVGDFSGALKTVQQLSKLIDCLKEKPAGDMKRPDYLKREPEAERLLRVIKNG